MSPPGNIRIVQDAHQFPDGSFWKRNFLGRIGNTCLVKIRALALILAALFVASPASGNAIGPVLPNAALTPGFINPEISQANIKTTICSSSYLAKIKPSSSFLNKVMATQLSKLPYSAYGDTNIKHFEEDLLIPLELGGSPTSIKNLWPEPFDVGFGARTKDFGAKTKDIVETKLQALVCSGVLSLKVAQKAIAKDWWAAYQKYVVTAKARATATPSPSVSPSASPSGSPSVSASPTPTTIKPVTSPTPTPNPTEYLVIPTSGENFLMPQLGLKNINTVLANWPKYGFKVQPVVQVMPPLYSTDTCLPWKESKGLAGVIASYSPAFNEEAGPQSQVMIMLNCEERGELNTTLQITQP
jgi:hypothetical protein